MTHEFDEDCDCGSCMDLWMVLDELAEITYQRLQQMPKGKREQWHANVERILNEAEKKLS